MEVHQKTGAPENELLIYAVTVLASFCYRGNRRMLSGALETLDGEIQLSIGCDFHLTAENLFDAKASSLRFSIIRKGYLLIESGNFPISSQMLNAFAMREAAGYKLITTLSERISR